MVAFYNQGDQEIYEGGQHYIPQEQYRLGYVPPGVVGANAAQGAGIPYTNAFTNAGGGGGGGGTFDTNIRTQQNYKRPDGSYVPGSIGLPGNIPQSGPGRQWSTDDPLAYGAGEDDEQNWLTRARKGLMGAVTPGLAMLKQGAQWLENKLPVNERAIMENELLGSGFAIDNNGRIVRMEGEYDTAGNIFSDYNAAQMDEDTFDDRIKSLGNMSVEGRRKRIAAIQLAKQQWQEAQGNTDAIIEKKQMDKQMQGYGGPETTSFDETITAAPTHINAGPLHGTGDKGQHSTQGGAFGVDKASGKEMMAQGGRIGFFQGALADTAEGQAMSPGTSASGGTHSGGYGRADVPLGGGNNFTSTDSSTIPIKQIAINEIMKKGSAQGGILGSVMGNIPQMMALKGMYDLFNKQRNDPKVNEEELIYGLKYGGLAGLL